MPKRERLSLEARQVLWRQIWSPEFLLRPRPELFEKAEQQQDEQPAEPPDQPAIDDI